MKDPQNPTHDEIKKWAYNPIAIDPMGQDWDLIIASDENADLLLELASDENCPNKNYFLKCLYLYIGDSLPSNKASKISQKAEDLVEKAKESVDPEIQRFVKRSENLFQHPEDFHYKDWCDNALVNNDNESLN